MTTQVPPKKNTAYTFYIGLVDPNNRPQFKAAPTLVTGDVMVSKDGAAFANITSLPSAVPAGGKAVQVNMSAAEMNADTVVVAFSSGSSLWDDVLVTLQTTAHQIDDLMLASAAPSNFGLLAIDGSGKVALTGSEHTAVQTDVTNGLTAQGYTTTRAGYLDTLNGLVASVWNALTSGMSTAGSIGLLIATDLDAKVSTRSTYAGADTAGTTTLLSRIASALTITGGKVDVNDKTGFSLSSAGVQAIWDALTSALTTVGSIGNLIVTNLDAAISSRSTYAGADTPGTTTLLSRIASAITITGGKVDVSDKTGFALTAGEHTNIASDVQTGLTAQGYTATRAGYLDVLNGIVAAIWNAATAGMVAAGSIGLRLATDIDAAISSRATAASIAALNNLSASQVENAVWDATMASHLTAGSTGSKLNAASPGGDPWSTSVPGAYGPGTAGYILGTNMDSQVSLRLPTSSYVAPDNASISTILTDVTNVQSRLPAALVGGKMDSVATFGGVANANVVQINGDATSADNLRASASTIVQAAAVTGTLSTIEMSTNLTETDNGHYDGRVIIWTSGVLKYQATDITAYDGTTKTLTFTAVTQAPSAGDTFVIV